MKKVNGDKGGQKKKEEKTKLFFSHRKLATRVLVVPKSFSQSFRFHWCTFFFIAANKFIHEIFHFWTEKKIWMK